MKTTEQRRDPTTKKALRAAHRQIKRLLDPPAQEHLKTIPASEVIQEWQQANVIPHSDSMTAAESRSGTTFAQYRARRRKSDEQILNQIYQRHVQRWLTDWIPEHHAELTSIEQQYPMGLQHPSILSFSHHAYQRATKRIINAFPHLFEGTPATDPSTVNLVQRMAIQAQHSPQNSSEHIQVRYYRAVAQAQQALQHLADHQPAIAIWYGALIRRQPDIHLPNDQETLLLRACQHSSLSPHEWDIISEFNPDLIASTMRKHSPQAAAIAWATLADLSQTPPIDAINTAAKQLTKLDNQSHLRIFQPVIRSFYIHVHQYIHDDLNQTPFLAHELIREVRHQHISREVPHLLATILEAAQHILADSKQSAVLHMTWEEWLHHTGLSQQKPAASSTHGTPTHQTTELLPIPPLDQDQLRERTTLTPPATPTDAWPTVPATDADTILYGTAAQLKRRGWTDKLITDLLGAPDRTAPNPVYRSAAKMRLYQRERVEVAEQHPTFVQHLNKSANRRHSAAKSSQHRRNDTIRWAAETPIHWVCPTQSFDELRAASRINSEHYDADQQCIDFVINHCSDLQAAVAQAYGMTGKSQANAVLITRICNEISKHWPQLHNACQRRIMDDLSE